MHVSGRISRLAMSDPDCQRPDYVQNALEATCDALITLESIRAAPAAGDWRPDLQVVQAITSLRQAISELRLAHAEDESAVALGFVVRTKASHEKRSRLGQASPRRTA